MLKAYVIQSGFLSASINIERGCRQGDPIVPYLFILCAQILCYMIIQNKKIRGINFNNTEIKISICRRHHFDLGRSGCLTPRST